ncbi:MAG: tRNA (adenosine(37)-N6)-threonylcarbamoyltransferase complex dimerization subunit type 1 TsaB [bacterium]|nr:tRNA (adenosine(37)-N6)-threonylcarbamoyltransferase complex dimerization subunit type 1 TsaB [bacterium]MDZ4248227.1 tRNA (adenosine(37)-N6)-threonylcarbamoyltransferase complex dimerization subunit type 1 TsaB [Patescibacteria group bacterium]
MRVFLLIDTADEPAVIALATARKVLAESTLADRKRLSEELLSRIDWLCAESGTKLAGLSAIGIVNGPGPFTALRIGTAVANALGYAHKLPLVPVDRETAPSLLAFAKLVAERLQKRDVVKAVLPNYGREPTITPPKDRRGTR